MMPQARSKTKGYQNTEKAAQRERDRSAGVCLVRRKKNPFPELVAGDGCEGAARPGKVTCQFCCDVQKIVVKNWRANKSPEATD